MNFALKILNTAYGEPHRTPAGQPILYGGKEHDPVTGEYNYDARRLFAPMLMTTTPDPLAGGTPHLSPYIFCAANPIRYIDLTGCEFTPNSMSFLNIFLQEIQRREDEANTIIETQNNLISSGTLSEKQINKADKQISKANRTLAEMSEIRAEISELEGSNQVYDIKVSDKYCTKNEFRDGTTINQHNSNVEISLFRFELKDGTYDFGGLAHELKHAYQFENGNLSFSGNRNGKPFYDQTDEYEAYDRGSLFGQKKVFVNQEYKYLQRGPFDVTNYFNL